MLDCPACSSTTPRPFVEEHCDPISAKKYRIEVCPDCGVVSSAPREAVGPDWYEKSAPIRDRERRPPPERDWRFRQFLTDRVPRGRVLDVGCGDGGFLRLAAAAGFSPIGFDFDARVAAQARAKGLDAHTAEFAVFCASRKPGEFDAITLFDVLEHTPEPSRFLRELERLLKPGGHLAITLPNGLRPLPWRREEHDFPPHHFTRWTPDSMKGFLERHGFEVVRQDAGALKLRYLSDHCFFFRVMPGLLALARRVLFGRSSDRDSATITELYARSNGARVGLLGDKLRRQRLVDMARFAFQIAFFPAALVQRAYCRAREPRSGDCLYTLARRCG